MGLQDLRERNAWQPRTEDMVRKSVGRGWSPAGAGKLEPAHGPIVGDPAIGFRCLSHDLHSAGSELGLHSSHRRHPRSQVAGGREAVGM
jgi:hypothetical protein